MEVSEINCSNFVKWLAAIQHRDWDTAESFLAPDVIVNGNAISPQAYIEQLRGEITGSKELEMRIVDDATGDIAARFSGQASLEPSCAWTEQTFYSFTRGKISSIQSLSAAVKTEEGQGTASIVTGSAASTESELPDLRRLYTDYIGAINTLTMDKHFDKFCQDTVTHNDHTYSRDEYRGMIESSFDDISGLNFTIETLIVNKDTQHVAARLGFTGVPCQEFRGIAPTGNSVKFSENAFYKLEEGRIRQVWSLLDLEAYKASIA